MMECISATFSLILFSVFLVSSLTYARKDLKDDPKNQMINDLDHHLSTHQVDGKTVESYGRLFSREFESRPSAFLVPLKNKPVQATAFKYGLAKEFDTKPSAFLVPLKNKQVEAHEAAGVKGEFAMEFDTRPSAFLVPLKQTQGQVEKKIEVGEKQQDQFVLKDFDTTPNVFLVPHKD